MVRRFQHVFLSGRILTSIGAAVLLLATAGTAQAAENDKAKINSDFFEVGVSTGMLNIEDFGSELYAGVSANFKATEDLFLQFNYAQSHLALSAFEQSQGRLFEGADRDFKHYDFLVGYNIFQGEVFRSNRKSNLSALYVVAGVGETALGGENNFSYTYGVGYQFALTRKIIVRCDYRNVSFNSSLLVEDELTRTTQIGVGVGYLF